MTAHPAALVLADHQPVYVSASTPPTAMVRCSRNATVQWCDFATHQTEALIEAGLLACPSCSHPASAHRDEAGCLSGWEVPGAVGCPCSGYASADAAVDALAEWRRDRITEMRWRP